MFSPGTWVTVTNVDPRVRDFIFTRLIVVSLVRSTSSPFPFGGIFLIANFLHANNACMNRQLHSVPSTQRTFAQLISEHIPYFQPHGTAKTSSPAQFPLRLDIHALVSTQACVVTALPRTGLRAHRTSIKAPPFLSSSTICTSFQAQFFITSCSSRSRRHAHVLGSPEPDACHQILHLSLTPSLPPSLPATAHDFSLRCTSPPSTVLANAADNRSGYVSVSLPTHHTAH